MSPRIKRTGPPTGARGKVGAANLFGRKTARKGAPKRIKRQK